MRSNQSMMVSFSVVFSMVGFHFMVSCTPHNKTASGSKEIHSSSITHSSNSGNTTSQAIDKSIIAQDQQMLSLCNEAAAKITKSMEGWVKTGAVTQDQLFNPKYTPILEMDPQKFHTDYDALSDKDIGPIQEAYFAKSKDIAWLIMIDMNGYVPTHNLKYRQPLTGDKERDRIGNRTKTMQKDPLSIHAAKNASSYLIETYKRDNGQIMKSLSVPLKLFGKHFGALYMGYFVNTAVQNSTEVASGLM